MGVNAKRLKRMQALEEAIIKDELKAAEYKASAETKRKKLLELQDELILDTYKSEYKSFDEFLAAHSTAKKEEI